LRLRPGHFVGILGQALRIFEKDTSRLFTEGGEAMDIGVNDIWFHDSKLYRVVENAQTDEIGFEVMYPVDWENDEFAERTIVFSDVLNYAVLEGPFHGRPTILEVYMTGAERERASLRIETNAGDRTLLCSAVEVRVGWGVI
jgi:hypothetical protein